MLSKKDKEEIAQIVISVVKATEVQKPAVKKQPAKEKKEVKKRVISVPYSEKHRILSEMTDTERKRFVPKAKFSGTDNPFPLDKRCMDTIFEEYEIDGNPWITYSEQIEHFVIPLMDLYKLSNSAKKERVKLMKGHLKGKIVDKNYKIKNSTSEKQKKVLSYQIKSLDNVLHKVESLKV